MVNLNRTLLLRCLEFVVLGVCLPVGAAILRWKTHVRLTPLVAVLLVLAFVLLWRDKTFDRQNLVRWEAFRAQWKSVIRRFIPLAAILGLIFALVKPAPAFLFPQQHPLQWLAFVLLAPVFPAYAEEVLFRVFFLHRYGMLFRQKWVRWLAGGVVFSLAHLHLANVWASVLSLIGGIMFMRTYETSRSAALVSLEHGLWAAYLFTIGLGPFFHPSLR